MEEKAPKAATRAKNKYNSKAYDQWLITAPKGKKEEYKSIADNLMYRSLNKFILDAIEEKIERES